MKRASVIISVFAILAACSEPGISRFDVMPVDSIADVYSPPDAVVQPDSIDFDIPANDSVEPDMLVQPDVKVQPDAAVDSDAWIQPEAAVDPDTSSDKDLPAAPDIETDEQAADAGPECVVDLQCNDNNPCTQDQCTAGSCSQTLKPDCCLQNQDCDDSDACTTDTCFENQCHHAKLCAFDCVNGECQGKPCVAETAAQDCNDSNACTVDLCAGGQCLNNPVSDCCNSAADCVDDNPCTIDTCLSNHTCNNLYNTNCCLEDSWCDDKDKCTIDVCVNNNCEHQEDPGCCKECCESNADCVSDDPCQAGYCVNSACVFGQIENCCVKQVDCDDGDFCTYEYCEPYSSTQTHSFCTQQPFCPVGSVCDAQNKKCIQECTTAEECIKKNLYYCEGDNVKKLKMGLWCIDGFCSNELFDGENCAYGCASNRCLNVDGI